MIVDQNRGVTTALRGVTVPEDADIIVRSEVSADEPVDLLPLETYDVLTVVTGGTPPSIPVTLEWIDTRGTQQREQRSRPSDVCSRRIARPTQPQAHFRGESYAHTAASCANAARQADRQSRHNPCSCFRPVRRARALIACTGSGPTGGARSGRFRSVVGTDVGMTSPDRLQRSPMHRRRSGRRVVGMLVGMASRRSPRASTAAASV